MDVRVWCACVVLAGLVPTVSRADDVSAPHRLFQQQASVGVSALEREFTEEFLLHDAMFCGGVVGPQLVTPASLNPVSACVGSACFLSFCGGSVCLGSGCAGSICIIWCPGSGTATSGCAGSACSGSGCSGSACGGSYCVGSLCAGSGCTGSACAASNCVLSSCTASTCTSSYCMGSGCTTSGCSGSSCVQTNCVCPPAGVARNGYPGEAGQEQASPFSQDVAAPIVSLGPIADGRLACSSNASGLHLVVYRDQGRIGQRQCGAQGRDRVGAQVAGPGRGG